MHPDTLSGLGPSTREFFIRNRFAISPANDADSKRNRASTAKHHPHDTHGPSLIGNRVPARLAVLQDNKRGNQMAGARRQASRQRQLDIPMRQTKLVASR